MNTPANTNKPAPQPEAELRAPENENTRDHGHAWGNGVDAHRQRSPIYGILHRSRAMTSQSDFFRLQFRGFARIEGNQWQHYANDDARFHTTYNCAWVRVDHPSRSVTFGPKNGVNCKAFAGQGWTPFVCPDHAWVKGIYPDYAINPGMIAITGNASEEENCAAMPFTPARVSSLTGRMLHNAPACISRTRSAACWAYGTRTYSGSGRRSHVAVAGHAG
jgi:hypothetical protein